MQVRAPSFVSRLSGTKASRLSPLGSSAHQAEAAWLPSSCRVRGGCPPSCHPRSRKEYVLMGRLHNVQPQPHHPLCHSMTVCPTINITPLQCIFGHSLSCPAMCFGEKSCVRGCGEHHSGCDNIHMLAVSCRRASVRLCRLLPPHLCALHIFLYHRRVKCRQTDRQPPLEQSIKFALSQSQSKYIGIQENRLARWCLRENLDGTPLFLSL